MRTISPLHQLLSLASAPRLIFGDFMKSAGHRRGGLFETLIQRSVQRRQLRALSDHQLRDIGITRAEAFLESEKPLWRG